MDNPTKLLNADPAELAKFEAIADKWWDRQGEFKPLHDINPLRINYIDERAPLAERKVLDVGCGGGLLSEGMSYRGARVTGIDLAKGNLEAARLHAESSGLTINYQEIAVEQLAEEQPCTFDIVTCLEMLEHVPDPASIIKACANLAKPGGHLFFSTLNRNPKSYLFAIVGAEYLLNLVPRGTHDYMKFIKPSELAGWIRDAGLLLKSIDGLTFNPISGEYKIEADVDVNYFVHCQKPSI